MLLLLVIAMLCAAGCARNLPPERRAAYDAWAVEWLAFCRGHYSGTFTSVAIADDVTITVTCTGYTLLREARALARRTSDHFAESFPKTPCRVVIESDGRKIDDFTPVSQRDPPAGYQPALSSASPNGRAF